MTESATRPAEEIERTFEQLNTLFDTQCRAILDQLPDLSAASLIELKKLEMLDELDTRVPEISELISNEPMWWDGYRYGLLRGYWRALCWVVNSDDEDLLTEKD